MFLHVKPLEKAGERLFRRDLDDRPGLPGVLIRLLRLVVLSYREFRHDFCWERGATLAFSTLLSLLPIVVLVMNVLSLPQIEDELKDFAKGIFARILPAEILGDGAGGPEEVSTDPEGVAEKESPAGGAANGDGKKPAGLKDEIKDLIERNLTADKLRISGGANIIATIGLIVAGLALLVSAERVFSAIWKAQSTRTYLQKFVVFWTILSLSPLLIGLSFYAISLGGTVEVKVDGPGAAPPSWWITALYSFAIPVFVSSFAFTLMNLFLPPIRVRFVPAIVGGFASGVLWETLKSVFGIYVERARGLESIYHGLTIVPVFLVFVYATWLAILVGAEISYTLQNYKRLIRESRRREHSEETGRYSAVFLGVFFLTRVMESYRAGKPPVKVDDVADVLGIYVEELTPALERLVEDGVLLESAGEVGVYVPAADPGSIDLEDVVRCLMARSSREEVEFFAAIDERERDAGRAPGDDPLREEIGEDLLRSRAAYLEAFAGRTLAELGADAMPPGSERRDNASDAPEGSLGDDAGARKTALPSP